MPVNHHRRPQAAAGRVIDDPPTATATRAARLPLLSRLAATEFSVRMNRWSAGDVSCSVALVRVLAT
jgi:hypothetical protein